MTPEQHERLGELFLRAKPLPRDQREAFCAALSGTDADLSDEVRALLAADDHEVAGLDQPQPAALLEPLLGAVSDHLVGVRLGSYLLRRAIASGGMGTVYEATQDHPRRVVALKVILPGLVSMSSLRRFEHEAEMLGRLQHPGIAQIHEAGSAEIELPGGRTLRQPFLAMELIQGVSLTEFAIGRSLSVNDRIELLARVCDAVQHAHERGVIHRDLKPGNILVDGSGTPKVLDFGIARLMDDDGGGSALHTATGQILGTLPYMSPEQVGGHPQAVDIRTDIYALGVLLFELLAGRLPLNVQRLSVADAVRVICEDDPSSLGSISRALRGDLDTIVRRAMEKNPARRYPTAGAFAADLRRFLRHEPLVARPPTTWYQLCKFARRHRALVTGVIIALVGLAFAAIAGVRQAVIEARARRNEQVLRQLADARAEEARRTAYRATMIAAADALHYHDLAGARLRLRETPADLRGWEYRHLDARIDEARLTIPIDVAPNLGLYFADHSSTLYLPDYQPPLSRVWGWNTTTGTLQTSPNSSPPWHDARGGCPEFKDVPLRLPDPDTGEIRLYDPGAWGVPKSAGLRAPRLGPGGRLFVFVTVLDSGPRLWFVDRASGWAASAPLSGTVNPGNRFIVISPDERRAIFMRDGWDGCVYNTQSAEVVATCEGHPQHSRPALFTANGLRIIAATDTNGLIAWDTETGRRLAHRADGSHDIMCLAGAGDPDTFASGGSDGAVRLWSADTLTPIGVRWGHVAPVRQLAFSPDTRTLASAADDRTLRLWSLDRFDETDLLAGHAAPVAALAISSDGKYVASGSTDGDVRLWLASTGRPIVSMAGHEDAVFQLAFSGNGAYLASAGNGPSIRVWSLPSGACVGSSTPRVFVTSGLGFHRDNRRVVLPWDEGEPISLWDPQTNTVEAAPFAVLAEILSPIVSPDRRLAVRGNRVFEVATGRVAARLPIPDFGTSTYSADGAQLITPAPGGDVALWNTRTLAQIRTLACQAREVNAIAVTPDGSRIFVAYSEPVIRIFDGHSYDEVAHLVGHTAAVRELRLSPDGSWLVSASDDKTVRIWRARATSE